MTGEAGKLAAAARWLGLGGGTRLDGRIVAVSPHLDDAVLSVAAALRAASGRGADVTVLTVFAGDPDSTEGPSDWDRRAGFGSAAAAARARRAEDERACRVIGARPVWLPFAEQGHAAQPGDDVIVEAVAAGVSEADVVLVPGFPLVHPDHVRAVRAARTAVGRAGGRVLDYVEQPYAVWNGGRPPAGGGWERLDAAARERLAKLRACRCYESQLPLLGRSTLRAIARYEAARGGELARTYAEERG